MMRQGLTFQLKSHKTSPVDTDRMYENLMLDVGPKEWSTNFNKDDFYENMSAVINEENSNQGWSKEYQPGYMFRNLGNESVYFNRVCVNGMIRVYR